ncbi:MAG: hypothetical protein K1X74_02140 [Pirellulales bacterium]|nr:hypothetical protein [Pirellulales bacterium]
MHDRSLQGVAPRTGEAALTRSFWLWCAVVVIPHAALLAAPPVNLEFAFLEGTRSLLDPQYADGATRYFAYQANPLGYSLLSAGLCRALQLPAADWSLRLLSLAGGVALLAAGREWFRLLRPGALGQFHLWAAVTMLCPLVWIYTGRGTADILPAGLACLAIAWCCRARLDARFHLLAGTCFALAAIVKFNVLLIGCAFVLLVLRQGGSLRSRVAYLACYTLLPAAVLGLYFVWLHQRFDVLLLGDRFKSMHNPVGYARQFWTVLALYLSYLAMLPGLLNVRPIVAWLAGGSRTRAIALAVAGLVLAYALGSVLEDANLGEMRFGGFDYLLPSWAFPLLRGGCLVLALALFGDIAARAWRERDELSLLLLAAVVPYLLVSSLSRPAQRYLLICLPLLLFYLVAAFPELRFRGKQRLAWATVVMFAGLSAVGSWYSVEQGTAAARMVDWIAAEGLLDQTHPGDIEAHAAHRFPIRSSAPPQFSVSAQPQTSALHVERVTLFGRQLRAYSLYRVDGAPVTTAAAEGHLR